MTVFVPARPKVSSRSSRISWLCCDRGIIDTYSRQIFRGGDVACARFRETARRIVPAICRRGFAGIIDQGLNLRPKICRRLVRQFGRFLQRAQDDSSRRTSICTCARALQGVCPAVPREQTHKAPRRESRCRRDGQLLRFRALFGAM